MTENKDKMTENKDKAAPMASAPMQYRENGEVAWGEMWESFCALALEGGPPHRGELLKAQPVPDTHSPPINTRCRRSCAAFRRRAAYLPRKYAPAGSL